MIIKTIWTSIHNPYTAANIFTYFMSVVLCSELSRNNFVISRNNFVIWHLILNIYQWKMSESIHHWYYSISLPNHSSSSHFTSQCHGLLNNSITNSLSYLVPLVNFTLLFHLHSHRHDQVMLATTTFHLDRFFKIFNILMSDYISIRTLSFCLHHNYCHGSNLVNLSFDLSKYHPN